MTRIIRNLGIIALLPLFGLVFWVAATVASSMLGLDVIGVNVHGAGLASYTDGISARPAPLSLQILQDAARDETGNGGGTASTPKPPLTPANASTPTPSPTLLPLPTPTPVPSLLPLPTPSPTPLPLPTPTPSLLPLPLPSGILPVSTLLP